MPPRVLVLVFQVTIRRSLLKENWKLSSNPLAYCKALLYNQKISIKRELKASVWFFVVLSYSVEYNQKISIKRELKVYTTTWNTPRSGHVCTIRRSLLKENWKSLMYLRVSFRSSMSIRRSLLKENWKPYLIVHYYELCTLAPIRRSLLKENWKLNQTGT